MSKLNSTLLATHINNIPIYEFPVPTVYISKKSKKGFIKQITFIYKYKHLKFTDVVNIDPKESKQEIYTHKYINYTILDKMERIINRCPSLIIPLTFNSKPYKNKFITISTKKIYAYCMTNTYDYEAGEYIYQPIIPFIPTGSTKSTPLSKLNILIPYNKNQAQISNLFSDLGFQEHGMNNGFSSSLKPNFLQKGIILFDNSDSSLNRNKHYSMYIKFSTEYYYYDSVDIIDLICTHIITNNIIDVTIVSNELTSEEKQKIIDRCVNEDNYQIMKIKQIEFNAALYRNILLDY